MDRRRLVSWFRACRCSSPWNRSPTMGLGPTWLVEPVERGNSDSRLVDELRRVDNRVRGAFHRMPLGQGRLPLVVSGASEDVALAAKLFAGQLRNGSLCLVFHVTSPSLPVSVAHREALGCCDLIVADTPTEARAVRDVLPRWSRTDLRVIPPALDGDFFGAPHSRPDPIGLRRRIFGAGPRTLLIASAAPDADAVAANVFLHFRRFVKQHVHVCPACGNLEGWQLAEDGTSRPREDPCQRCGARREAFRPRRVPARLYLHVGSRGPLALTKLRRALGLDGLVYLQGDAGLPFARSSAEVAARLAACDLYMESTSRGGLGKGVSAAAAVGLPTIVPSWGANSDFAGSQGSRVEVRSQSFLSLGGIEAEADEIALFRMLERSCNAEWRQRKGQAARRAAEAFRAANVSPMWARALSELDLSDGKRRMRQVVRPPLARAFVRTTAQSAR
jgi:hypothetical protein